MSGGALKKNTSLRIVWTTEQETMLLNLWEEKIEELRGSRKNSHVYQEIAAAMQNAGFSGIWTDLRTKVDNLTRKYKTEKSKIGPTGGTPSNWEHYDMSSIINEAEDIIEYKPNASCSRFCQSDFEATQTPPSRKKKVDTNTKLLKLTEERIDLLKQQQKEKKTS